jgi:hypothetical protein
VVFVVVVHDDVGHVDHLATDGHAVRLVPARAEDGATLGQDAREHFAVELHRAVLHESTETVTKTDDLHAVEASAALPTPRMADSPGQSPPDVDTTNLAIP